ncbi:MAG: hypothetical protein MUO77_02730, partial [Anaerolineales bacterium]|nr:hypothetical protein [Anaerolineales bacterium]
NNTSGGLRVLSDGSITIGEITAGADAATGNGGHGAYLDNRTGTGGITINGAGIFNGNTLNGLYALTNGDITSSVGVSASNNGGYGALLDNTGSSTNNVVGLSGTNLFNNNTSGGLRVLSDGSITIGEITAGAGVGTGNGGHGAYLDNRTGTGGITINGAGIFNNNTLDGLNAQSTGNITSASELSANDNSGNGAKLDNSSGTSNVVLTGRNTFNHNRQDGLHIISKGAVILDNTTAGTDAGTGNGGSGASIDNSAGNGNINLNGAGIFNGNASSGLKTFSNGAINLVNITASDNISGYGAYLIAQGAGKAVTLTGTNIFNNNGLDGLYINANGNIDIFDVTANSNGGSGLFLRSTANITVHDCTDAANNGGVGAYADLPGLFFLRMGDFSGNGSGAYALTGGGARNVKDCVKKPKERGVNLTGEQTVPLVCVATTLTLPNGDYVSLPCPIGEASLTTLTEDDLIDALPEGTTFTSGFNLQIVTEAGSVAVGGEARTSANETMIVSFAIPKDQLNADLALFSWNGSKWIEVEDIMVENGHLNAQVGLNTQVDFDGLFILASK